MAMSFEDVDVEAVAELSAEEVDEREVFEQEEKEQVEGVLDFFLGGGLSKVEISYRTSLISSLILEKTSTLPPPQGGRQRASRIRSGELDQSQPVVIDGCLYGQVSKHCSDVCGHDALMVRLSLQRY